MFLNSLTWNESLFGLSVLCFSGILVPGGFGVRGTEGKIHAISWARKQKKPFLGTHYKSQCMFTRRFPVDIIHFEKKLKNVKKVLA